MKYTIPSRYTRNSLNTEKKKPTDTVVQLTFEHQSIPLSMFASLFVALSRGVSSNLLAIPTRAPLLTKS